MIVIITKQNKAKTTLNIGNPTIIYPAPQGVLFSKDLDLKK